MTDPRETGEHLSASALQQPRPKPACRMGLRMQLSDGNVLPQGAFIASVRTGVTQKK
jgi:hypothetical protein